METDTPTLTLSPEQYSSVPVYNLLQAAARGHIGIDHRVLHAIVDDPKRAIPDLLRFGLEDAGEYPIQLEEDLIAIFRHIGGAEALPFYMECIKRYPGEMPDDLLEAFQHIGAEAVDPLLKLYEELGDEEGAEIPFVLAALGVRDPRVLAVLREHLDYDAADGTLCLGLYGDPSTKPALEKLLLDLDNSSPEFASLRRDVEDALEQIGTPREDEALPHFDLWEQYPETAEPIYDVWSEADRIAYLSNPSAEERISVAASFFNTDLSSAARAKLFSVAKNDPDPRVRARCWEALSGELENKEIRAAMMKRTRDPELSPVEKGGLAIGLSYEAGESDVRGFVVGLYEKPETRAKALEAMWRSLDRSFSEYFPQHLDDADVDIQRQSIWGAGHLSIKTAAPRIRRFFDSDNLRADALFAYSLCVPVEVKPGKIRILFDEIEKAAGGLSHAETELVENALDHRLMIHGLDPIFSEAEVEEEEEDDPGHDHAGHHHHHPPAVEAPPTAVAPSKPVAAKVGRNDVCPCGSGKKHKKCCGA